MLFDDTYQTIQSESTGEFRDRGSKFLGFAFPVTKELMVKEIIQRLKKEHPQANHHCYAFRLTPDSTIFRASDDREPSGTAGKPILGAILSLQLTDICVVVVRYFGGSLLGVPGLIAAYRAAAQDALQQATIITKTVNEKIEIKFPYENINDVHSLIKSEPVKIIHQNFDEPCSLIFELRKSRIHFLLEKLKTHPALAAKATWEIIL